MQHYEAYKDALKEGEKISLLYLKLILFGPPRSGKSSTRRRLMEEIANITGENTMSTKLAESTEAILMQREILTSGSATVMKKEGKWKITSLNKEFKASGDVQQDQWEGDARYLAKIYYSLIMKNKSPAEDADDTKNADDKIHPNEINKGNKNPIPNLNYQGTAVSKDYLSGSTPSSKLKSIEKAFEDLASTLVSHSPEDFQHLVENLIIINVIDSVGQPAFLEMLPMLTIGSALYLLFFRMDQELQKLQDIKFCAHNRADEDTLDSCFSIENVLCQGLSCIACFGCNPLSNSQPSDSQLSEAQIYDSPPSDSQSSGAQPSDYKQSGAQPSDSQPSDSQPSDSQPSDSQPSDSQPSDSQPSGAQPSGGQSSGVQGVNAPQNISKALLIGTFKDEVRHRLDECVTNVNSTLWKKLVGIKKDLLLKMDKHQNFFQVDNKHGIDDDIDKMRTVIGDFVSNNYCSREVPPSWLMFRIILSFMNESFLTLSECKAIASKLDMSEKSMLDALWFLHHHIGSLMYYPDIESMKDIVICNPQAIFDCISEVIINTFKPSNAGITIKQSEVDEFEQTGQFTLEQIDRHLQGKQNVYLSLQQVIDLLKAKNIIAEIETGSPQSPKKYIMPSVLKSAPEEDLQLTKTDGQACPLVIYFECGFVPFGVFCGTVSRLIAHHKWQLHKKEEVKKNKVKFQIEGTYIVEFNSQPFHLGIQVTKVSHARKNKTPLPEMCSLVRDKIVTSLNEVCKQMKYKEMLCTSDNQLCQLAFPCVCSSEPSGHLMKVVDQNQYCRCLECESEHDLTDNHTFWFNKVS